MTKSKSGKTAYEINLPCTFDSVQGQDMFLYSMLYNVTLVNSVFLNGFKKPLPKNYQLFKLKTSIDNAILELKHEEFNREGPAPRIEAANQNFPYNPDRIVRGADPIQSFGSFYLVMVPLTIFIVMYDEMVREKVLGLRMGLMVVGCSNSAFWIAWFITGIVFNFFMSVMIIFTGWMWNFNVFLSSPHYVLFYIFFMSGLNNLALAFLMMTLMKNQVQAYTASFSVLLAQIIITLVLNDCVLVYKVFFNLDMPDWVKYPRALFYLMPTFHFVKMYGDLTRITCMHFKLDTPTWVPGREWVPEDLYTGISGHFATKDRYDVPSIFHSMKVQFAITTVYFILAWYFDNVLASNRGNSAHPLFLFKPSYWFSKFLKPKQVMRKASIFNEKHTNKIRVDTAQEEKRMVQAMEKAKEECTGLRICGLSKTFPGGLLSDNKDDVRALRNLWIEVEEGECLGIMGHNGAGKTTLVNVISGMMNPTGGNARIYNQQLIEDLEEIRFKLGVVF